MPKEPYGQRDYMRKLVAELGRNRDAVCAAYAKAERDGVVERKKNETGEAPENYALRLWLDGEAKGWF